MHHTLLVPLDGSPSAEAALPWAAELARHRHLTILLAHVIPWPPPSFCVSPDIGSEALLYDQWLEGEREDAEDYLEPIRQRLVDQGVAVDVVVVEGNAANRIV